MFQLIGHLCHTPKAKNSNDFVETLFLGRLHISSHSRRKYFECKYLCFRGIVTLCDNSKMSSEVGLRRIL